jgi:DNA-binding transcriptional ArsR family regulator
VAAFRAEIPVFFVLHPLPGADFPSERRTPQHHFFPHSHGKFIDEPAGKVIAMMASGNAPGQGTLPDIALLAVHVSGQESVRRQPPEDTASHQQRQKSVSAIVEELDLSQPLVSHHLKELKRSLLVKVEREGPFIYYELADSRILDVLRNLERDGNGSVVRTKDFLMHGGKPNPMDELFEIISRMAPEEALSKITRSGKTSGGPG